MNPLKCVFGVTSRKFMRFIIHHRGIEIGQSNIKAIREMPEPNNLRELQGLQGRLAYIRRFTSNLAGCCHPFCHFMKKCALFEWNELCHTALKKIKEYLFHPSVLGAPNPRKPLMLYIAAQEKSLGTLCVQENAEGKEVTLYTKVVRWLVLNLRILWSKRSTCRLSFPFRDSDITCRPMQCRWSPKSIPSSTSL